MTKKLTIIIPTLNEGTEPVKTIESIHETVPDNLIDIIIIDDASDDMLTGLDKFSNVRYVKKWLAEFSKVSEQKKILVNFNSLLRQI